MPTSLECNRSECFLNVSYDIIKSGIAVGPTDIIKRSKSVLTFGPPSIVIAFSRPESHYKEKGLYYEIIII